MNFTDFVINYWSSILVVVLFVVACIVLIKKGYTKYVKQICFYLVCEAEEQFGNGTGTLKYAAVTTWLYEKLPLVCKWLFTEKQLDTLIETAVTEMKDWLSKNKEASNLIIGETNKTE